MMMDISNKNMFTNAMSFSFQQTLLQLAEWFAFSKKLTKVPHLPIFTPIFHNRILVATSQSEIEIINQCPYMLTLTKGKTIHLKDHYLTEMALQE